MHKKIPHFNSQNACIITNASIWKNNLKKKQTAGYNGTSTVNEPYILDSLEA